MGKGVLCLQRRKSLIFKKLYRFFDPYFAPRSRSRASPRSRSDSGVKSMAIYTQNSAMPKPSTRSVPGPSLMSSLSATLPMRKDARSEMMEMIV